VVTWMGALARTRGAIAGALRRVLRRERPDPSALEELEETLWRADVAPRLAAELVAQIERGYGGLRVPKGEMLCEILTRRLRGVEVRWQREERPWSVLVVGVNGSGKTTTCAKLARRVRAEGLKPLLGAGDTFRAAGAEQLRLWAERVPCDVVAGAAGADAAAVAYDALDAAVARGTDVMIFDTAGRMHTRAPLMEELRKVRRVLGRRRPGAPEETWIVLDAALGRNALVQARAFHETVPLTGVIVSKLDGSSKAGFIYSIAEELDLPILFAGLGEGPDDLVPFDPETFSRALLGLDGEAE